MYEEINKIIESYRATDNLDYALLLTGEWGCGKTYYVEHTLSEIVEKSGGRILYASLHGIRSYDQIIFRLMLSNIAAMRGLRIEDIQQEYWANKVFRVIDSAGGFWDRLISTSLIHWYTTSKKKAYKIDRDNTLIVIDDLERAIDDETRKEILGRLYEDYIRRGYHVILIGDETKINKNSSYFECKEKYVRRSINIGDWQANLILEFAKLRCARIKLLYSFIKDNLRLFVERQKIVNLRLVSQIIDSVIDIVAKLETPISEENARLIFSASAPLVHAYSKGLLLTEDISDYACLTELETIRTFYNDKEKRSALDVKMQKACDFYDRYCSEVDCQFVLIKSIFRYVLTGYLDKESFNAEMSKLFQKTTSPEGAAFEMLVEYWRLEEEDILESLQQVRSYLEAGKYNFNEILTVYGCFLRIKSKLYVSIWPYEDELKEVFLRYIRIRSSVEEVPSFDELRRLRFHRESDSMVCGIEALYVEIDKFYNEKINEKNRKRVDNFFVALKNKNGVLADSYSTPENDSWRLFIDIIQYNKELEVAQLPVYGIKYIEYEIQSRILNISNSAEFEKNQIPSIKKLAEYLENYVRTCSEIESKKARILELVAMLRKAIIYMEGYLKAHTS